MVKFYGNNSEIVFDSNRNSLLCKFSNGELTTTDKYVIERLKELGFKYEEEVKSQPKTETKATTKPKTKGR
mgnify:CR=1 FL=1